MSRESEPTEVRRNADVAIMSLIIDVASAFMKKGLITKDEILSEMSWVDGSTAFDGKHQKLFDSVDAVYTCFKTMLDAADKDTDDDV